MKIHGAEGMSPIVINDQLDRGAKFVVFEFCVSFLFITYRKSSDVYFIKSDEHPFFIGLPWSFLNIILGWWGLPWGPLRTVESLITNFGGGKNVTQKILAEVYTHQGLTVS